MGNQLHSEICEAIFGHRVVQEVFCFDVDGFEFGIGEFDRCTTGIFLYKFVNHFARAACSLLLFIQTQGSDTISHCVLHQVDIGFFFVL